MSHAEKCPVCEGRGSITICGFTVPYGSTEVCHGCGGKGWVEVGSAQDKMLEFEQRLQAGDYPSGETQHNGGYGISSCYRGGRLMNKIHEVRTFRMSAADLYDAAVERVKEPLRWPGSYCEQNPDGSVDVSAIEAYSFEAKHLAYDCLKSCFGDIVVAVLKVEPDIENTVVVTAEISCGECP